MVLYAITFLISFWNSPTDAAKNAVTAPVIIIIVNAKSDCSSNGEHLINKYTPAVLKNMLSKENILYINIIRKHPLIVIKEWIVTLT
jgi:hypothetical protein